MDSLQLIQYVIDADIRGIVRMNLEEANKEVHRALLEIGAKNLLLQDKAQKYDDLMAANSEVVQKNIDITKDHVKAARYDMLKDRYLNQNEKHFDELCGEYFDV